MCLSQLGETLTEARESQADGACGGLGDVPTEKLLAGFQLAVAGLLRADAGQQRDAALSLARCARLCLRLGVIASRSGPAAPVCPSLRTLAADSCCDWLRQTGVLGSEEALFAWLQAQVQEDVMRDLLAPLAAELCLASVCPSPALPPPTPTRARPRLSQYATQLAAASSVASAWALLGDMFGHGAALQGYNYADPGLRTYTRASHFRCVGWRWLQRRWHALACLADTANSLARQTRACLFGAGAGWPVQG